MSEYRIYDDRTNETLCKGTKEQCMRYLFDVDENHEDFEHIWIEEDVYRKKELT